MSALRPLVMLPGAGPACEGDDCGPDPAGPAGENGPAAATTPGLGA